MSETNWRERAERAERLVDLLRADLLKFMEIGPECKVCEGCGAPIADDEDVATAADVEGCWGYVSDWKGSPCYRYRTAAGADRSWPECPAA